MNRADTLQSITRIKVLLRDWNYATPTRSDSGMAGRGAAEMGRGSASAAESVANDGGSLPFLIVCAVDYDASDGLGAGRCSDRFYCAGYVGAARVGPAR